jgi:GT2 family glycosyltransferase
VTQTVAAVVVTYRRPAAVVATVRSLIGQTRPPEFVVVVDNASDGTTRTALAGAGILESVHLLPQSENHGFEGGLAVGIAYTRREIRPAWYLLLDDDSPIEPDSLRDGLRALQALPDRSVLANRGADLPWGRVRSVYGHGLAAPRSVDVCLFDGTLYPSAAVDAVGLPRADFFLMFGDYEYALRLRRAGFEIFVGPSVRSTAAYAGFGSSPPWRAYYQTRNQFRTALELRSPTLLLGAVDRLVRQVVTLALHRDDRYLLRIRMRLLGVWHAGRGRMGRTIDPADPRFR